MKKEIEKLLASENGRLEINSMFELHRWQKDALGNKVNELTLELRNINNVNYNIVCIVHIAGRTYTRIMKEIESNMRILIEELEERLISNVRTGYLENPKIKGE